MIQKTVAASLSVLLLLLSPGLDGYRAIAAESSSPSRVNPVEIRLPMESSAPTGSVVSQPVPGSGTLPVGSITDPIAPIDAGLNDEEIPATASGSPAAVENKGRSDSSLTPTYLPRGEETEGERSRVSPSDAMRSLEKNRENSDKLPTLKEAEQAADNPGNSRAGAAGQSADQVFDNRNRPGSGLDDAAPSVNGGGSAPQRGIRAILGLRQAFQKQEPPELSPAARAVLDPYWKSQAWGTIKAASLNPFFSVAMKMIGGYDAVKSASAGSTAGSAFTVPFAAILASRFPLKNILISAAAVRTTIWSVLVPTLALTLAPGAISLGVIPIALALAPVAVLTTGISGWWAVKQWRLSTRGALGWSLGMAGAVLALPSLIFGLGGLDLFQSLLSTAMLTDGFAYAFQQAYDMDTGGVQQLAKEHGFFNEVNTAKVLNFFDARYENVYFAASAFFPLLIGLIPILAAHWVAGPIVNLILGAMSLTFAFSGVMEIWHLSRIPRLPTPKPALELRDYSRHLWEGVTTIVSDKRLLSNALLETLGDAGWRTILRLIVLPYFGYLVIGPALGLNAAWGAYFGVVLVSVASLAGSIAGWGVQRYWRAPQPNEVPAPRYHVFFNLTLVAGLLTITLPLGYLLIASGHIAAGIALTMSGVFLFNLLFQAGRQGMRNIKKKIAGEHGDAGRVFGVTESLDAGAQGLTAVAFAGLLDFFSGHLLPVLWITFGFFSAFGLLSQGGRWWHFYPEQRGESRFAVKAGAIQDYLYDFGVTNYIKARRQLRYRLFGVPYPGMKAKTVEQAPAWSNSPTLEQSILLEPARPDAARYGPYSVDHAPAGLAVENRPQEPVSVIARQGPPADETLREHFAKFDRIIENNFSALLLIDTHRSSMQRRYAEQIYEKVLAMATDYQAISGDGQPLRELETVRAKLFQRLANANDLTSLDQGELELVVSAVGPSLHQIIQSLHQKTIEQGGKVDGSFPANLLLEKAGDKRELSIVNLSYNPVISDGRIVSPALKTLADILVHSKKKPQGAVFLQDDQFWAHFQLGWHSVEVYVSLRDPDEGGIIRIRYQEWDTHLLGTRSRLRYIGESLSQLGASVSEDKGFLTAIIDKNHRSQNPDQMARTASAAMQILGATTGVDYGLPQAMRGRSLDHPENRKRVKDWASIAVANNGLPFFHPGTPPDDAYPWFLRRAPNWLKAFLIATPAAEGRVLSRGFQEYSDEQSARQELREALNRELSRLGLQPIGDNETVGQRTIDSLYNRAMDQALARGELLARDGRLERNAAYSPIQDTAKRALARPREMAETAQLIGSLDPALFDFETLGTAGILHVRRAQRALDPGRWLTVYVMRDFETDQIVFARAELDSPDSPPRDLNPEEAIALLKEQGYPIADFMPSESTLSVERNLKKLKAAPETQEQTAEAFRGLAVSPGRAGRPVIGPVTFDASKAARGGFIYAAEFTTVDDVSAIGNSLGVLTLSGGALSHAGITTRELQVPAVILRQGRRLENGNFEFKAYRFSEPRKTGGIYYRRIVARVPVPLREGDVIRMNPSTGEVEFVESERQGILLATERLMALYDADHDAGSLARRAGEWIADSLDERPVRLDGARELLLALASRLQEDPAVAQALLIAHAALRAAPAESKASVSEMETSILAEQGALLQKRLRRVKEMIPYAQTQTQVDWVGEEERKITQAQEALRDAFKDDIPPDVLNEVHAAPLVVPVSEIDKFGLSAKDVGGKNFNLAKLASAVREAGGHVAPAVAITVRAYRRFLRDSGVKPQLDALMRSEDLSLEAKAAQARALIVNAKLSPQDPAEQAILSAVREAALGSSLAVRSSAVDEDSSSAAFAGAGDTRLYVPAEPEEILRNVQEVWASVWNDRALVYRQEQAKSRVEGLDLQNIGQSVVIQEMVPAEVSGVLFTREPVSGHIGRNVINAGLGLGEGIVSGLQTPDQYVLDKKTGLELKPAIIASKNRWIVPNPQGRGVQEMPVPAHLRRVRSLNSAQLQLLNRVAVALEKLYGCALDIEFAFAKGKLYILQARPITTH